MCIYTYIHIYLCVHIHTYIFVASLFSTTLLAHLLPTACPKKGLRSSIRRTQSSGVLGKLRGSEPRRHHRALAAAGGPYEPCRLAGLQHEGDALEHLAWGISASRAVALRFLKGGFMGFCWSSQGVYTGGWEGFLYRVLPGFASVLTKIDSATRGCLNHVMLASGQLT